MKVSYLGPEGSYTHTAALKTFSSDKTLELIPAPTITNIIHDLEIGLVEKAIVPIENSIAGGVAETVDALQKSENVFVVNEMVLPIDHCLLAVPGTNLKNHLDEITKVSAHHMTLGQCMDFIRKNLASAEIEPSSSNSIAAKRLKNKYAADQDVRHEAVIASRHCAEIYNLEIISESINDASINETRFWILSRDINSGIKTPKNKTTILFQTKDEPGSLQMILRIFAINHVNLSRIESRPAKKNLGEYLFLIDFDLHRDDSRFDDLMRQVKQHFTYYKWIGSYCRMV
jgi:prephenate dehydratase